MNSRSILFLILLLGCCTPVYPQEPGGNNPNKPVSGPPSVYALVIGISSYLQKEIPQLQFADRDAAVFASYLKSKAGGSVPDANITLLVDSAATTSAVYDAIYNLSKVCKPGDLVYFYFSGHGDLENATMYKNGFLICYDSPPNNYVKLSLSIDYLNDIANTLSVQTNANVVLITDACHSGKLAASKFKGSLLVGDQLRAVRNKEIRITACAENQLSNENEAWGGGRGVFSYYLINGLKGMADLRKDGVITLDEVKTYMDSSLSKDVVLKNGNIIQTPVLNGNGNFQLARVDTDIKIETEKELMKVSQSLPLNMALPATGEELVPANGQQYFFYLLKKDSLEKMTTDLSLDELPVDQIPFRVIRELERNNNSADGKNKLTELDSMLHADPVSLKKFNGKLAVAFDEIGQKVINQYLIGDAAELERRRYYNSSNNGYDVYPKMFSVALKLTQPDSYLHNILEVKLHYFTGVALRLKMPTVEDPEPLIEQALDEQKKALALEEHAAYLYNELGILYQMKKQYTVAEKYYIHATELSPDWVVPWANLSGLYAATRSFEKGLEATEKAKGLSPDLMCIYVNSGYLYEKKGDQLMAEELYRNAIHLNSRHYSPFERLGYVFMNTTRYELADSFFHEAALRKKGYHFPPGEFEPEREMVIPAGGGDVLCKIYSNDVGLNDVMGHCVLGINVTCFFVTPDENIHYQVDRINDDSEEPLPRQDMENGERNLKKAIEIDNSNPLAFHYLGKLLYWQKRWAEAEGILKLALKYHRNTKDFDHYVDSMKRLLPVTPSKECIILTFSNSNYDPIEDNYFLASLYVKWRHFTEAEREYRRIISIDPAFFGGYSKLCTLLESMGRYMDAEEVIRSFIASNPDKKISGENELHAFYNRVLKVYPNDASWNYKAGTFLYHLAADHQDDYPEDLKAVTPDTNEEMFTSEAPRQKNYVNKYWPLPWKSKIYQKAQNIYYPRNEGIACLLKADSLSAFPDEAVADINDKIGDLYSWQGLPERAVPHYRKSLNLQPRNEGVRMKLVDVLDTLYHFQDALVQLDSLFLHNALGSSNFLLMAKYRLLSGDFAGARQLLDSAEKINPNPVPGIIELNGRVQLLSGNEKEALVYYKKLLAGNENDKALYYTIARIFAKQGKMDEAWKWLESSADKGFKYTYVLLYDPYLENLRNSAKWNPFLQHINEQTEKKPATIKRFSEGY